MARFTVYLFMRAAPDDAPPGLAERRLRVLQAVREELIALENVCLSATPDHADLQVEITNIFGVDGGPVAGPGKRRSQRSTPQRILIVRLSVDEDRLDLVCSDGPGNVTAERLAARRIHSWLNGWERYREDKTQQIPVEWAATLTTSC